MSPIRVTNGGVLAPLQVADQGGYVVAGLEDCRGDLVALRHRAREPDRRGVAVRGERTAREGFGVHAFDELVHHGGGEGGEQRGQRADGQLAVGRVSGGLGHPLPQCVDRAPVQFLGEQVGQPVHGGVGQADVDVHHRVGEVQSGLDEAFDGGQQVGDPLAAEGVRVLYQRLQRTGQAGYRGGEVTFGVRHLVAEGLPRGLHGLVGGQAGVVRSRGADLVLEPVVMDVLGVVGGRGAG